MKPARRLQRQRQQQTLGLLLVLGLVLIVSINLYITFCILPSQQQPEQQQQQQEHDRQPGDSAPDDRVSQWTTESTVNSRPTTNTTQALHRQDAYKKDTMRIGNRNAVVMVDKDAGLRPESSSTWSNGGTVARRIPRMLIFTHSVNLLNDTAVNEQLQQETDDELVALQRNVHRIVKLHEDTTITTTSSGADADADVYGNAGAAGEPHPPLQVQFLTNEDCIASIRQAAATALRVGDEHSSSNATTTTATTNDLTQRLIQYFQNEPRGMYKADLCRGAALYNNGGIYVDVDLGVRLNLFDVLQPTTTFATVKVHRQSKQVGIGFFQAFMAATPRHPVIRHYLQAFLDYYDGKLPQFDGRPLGVMLLKSAFDQAIAADSSSNLESTTELWQELLYPFAIRDDKKVENDVQLQYMRERLRNVDPPTWGTRRACKFITVVTNRNGHPRLFASTADADESEAVSWQVPFYSRIGGSRMCPIGNPGIGEATLANTTFAQ